MHASKVRRPRLRRLSPFTGMLLLALLPFAAAAVGLGPAPGSVPIGQPLDFNIAIRLDGEESLAPECVQAEVQVGERAVPSQLRIRATSAGSALLRVSTTAAVEEPVVSITVHAGCTGRVTRRYVVFADPAGSGADAAAASAAAVPTRSLSGPSTGPLPGALPAAALPPADVVTQTAPPGAGAAPSRRAERSPRGERAPRPARSTRSAGVNRPARTAMAPAPTPPAAPVQPPRSRLKLDNPEPPDLAGARPPGAAVEEALAAVALAASQARAAAEAASASARRIAELERSVEAARSEARTQRAEADRLRAQPLQSQELPWWSWALFTLSVLLALVAAWMAWRIRGMQQAHEAAWARATAMPVADSAPVRSESTLKETSPLPLITSELTQPAALSRPALKTAPPPPSAPVATRAAEPRPSPPVPKAPEPDDEPSAVERTQIIPPTVRVDPRHHEEAPRDVSIEELIDVDQQAEFFIAIGQDHAAVDLLVTHLRSTGGGSPLTYLKLLDIYRRLGEQENYDRTRSRFNHRFNAYAPEWGADLQAGRSLEAYDGVVPRLQAAWPRPLDAMAELEALLFRKSRGELFELPAYRDVLFLYALARDLLERENAETGGEPGNVDLLLPLNPDAAASTLPRVGDARATSDTPPEDLPTAPLDLDLTPIAPTPAPSIFGEPMAPRRY